MTFLPVTCDNCGAKYKLPESFTGSQAKCQKCGSVIDVQKQRAAHGGAAATPAAAKPAAAARPAVDRSKAAAPAGRPAERSERPARAGRGKAAAKGDDGGEATPRGRRERGEAKKNNPMPLVIGGVSLVAIVVVVVVMMQSGTPPAETPPNTANQAAADAPAEKPVEKPAEKPAEPPAAPTNDAPAAAAASDATAKPAEKPAEQPAAPAAQPAEASVPMPDVQPGQVARPWQKMRNPPQSMDQVTDPKSYAEVTWPESIAEGQRTEVRGLVEDVANGGRAGIRAKPKLLEEGVRYAAMFGIVEKLRTLDYRSTEASQLAFEYNKLLEEITAGLNARFEPVEATEDIHPAKAEWNTRTVNGWIGLIGKYADEDVFKKERAERVKKAAGDAK